MTVRVALNGFGRIGRSVLRAALTDPAHAEIEIVAINDIARPDIAAYLFEYDSVFGPWKGEVRIESDALVVDGRRLRLTGLRDISGLDLSDIDIVMECTGLGGERSFSEAGLKAGAARVLVSGPSKSADLTLVLGANEDQLQPEHRIVSNASCTTNALAPLA
ncbi:MAG: glyceraldehyde 3-phosphate dehydrogenase NAD-binding domain-containing protein, partial [Albidovulum sp.]